MILIKEGRIYLKLIINTLCITDGINTDWIGHRGTRLSDYLAIGPLIKSVLQSLLDCGYATIEMEYKGVSIQTEIISKTYTNGHQVVFHVLGNYGIIKGNLKSMRAAKMLITKLQKEGSNNDL